MQGPISSENGRVRQKLGNEHHPDHRCIFDPTRKISKKARGFFGLKKLLLNFGEKIIKINLKLIYKTSFKNTFSSVHGSTFQRKKIMNFSPKKIFQY